MSDFWARHIRCYREGDRIVRHDIDCKHRDEHEQRPTSVPDGFVPIEEYDRVVKLAQTLATEIGDMRDKDALRRNDAIETGKDLGWLEGWDEAKRAAVVIAEREERICTKQATDARGQGRVSKAEMHRAGAGLAKSIAYQIKTATADQRSAAAKSGGGT